MRETHWRDILEDKSSLANLQRMVWPCVKWEWKNIFIPLSPLLVNWFYYFISNTYWTRPRPIFKMIMLLRSIVGEAVCKHDNFDIGRSWVQICVLVSPTFWDFTYKHESIEKVLLWIKFSFLATPTFSCDAMQLCNQSTCETQSTFETAAFRRWCIACVSFGRM